MSGSAGSTSADGAWLTRAPYSSGEPPSRPLSRLSGKG